MPETENALQQRPSEAGLVLLDSSFRPVSYNAEAIRILTYKRDPREIHPLTRHMETQLRSLLDALRSSGRLRSVLGFQSGRRRYGVRIFTLNNHRKTSRSSGSNPAHALLLERRDRKFVDLRTAAQHFHLTPREQETLGFLVQGMTSKEIAKEMGISPNTVKAFLRLVMSKMQVSTRSGIIGKIVGISY